MSTVRKESAKHLKDADGKTVCSCGCGQHPKPPRRRWFSEPCVHSWMIRNSPQYVRGLVKERDKGVCAGCGVDTREVRARKLSNETKDFYRYLGYWSRIGASVILRSEPDWHNSRGDRSWHAALMEARERYGLNTWQEEFDRQFEKSEWQADHIIPVCEGGGQCGLENYRTLCTPCHKQETRELAARRAAARRISIQLELLK